MKKYLKIGAFLAAFLLIGFLIYLVDVFTGYPVSFFRVQRIAEQYMEENDYGTDYVLEKPSYSLKLGGFTMKATIPNSEDREFQISFYRSGELKYDTYEQDVLHKVNTAIRLSNEYHAKLRDVFENSDFPFAADINGDFQSARTGEIEQRNEPGSCPEKWDIQELILDGEYDISQLSGRYGTVILRVTSRDVSAKTAAESLLRLKAIMEKQELPFHSVTLWLLSEKTDDSGNPMERMQILNFGWDDIYEEGLEERVKEAAAATEAYYDRSDRGGDVPSPSCAQGRQSGVISAFPAVLCIQSNHQGGSAALRLPHIGSGNGSAGK